MVACALGSCHPVRARIVSLAITQLPIVPWAWHADDHLVCINMWLRILIAVAAPLNKAAPTKPWIREPTFAVIRQRGDARNLLERFSAQRRALLCRIVLASWASMLVGMASSQLARLGSEAPHWPKPACGYTCCARPTPATRQCTLPHASVPLRHAHMHTPHTSTRECALIQVDANEFSLVSPGGSVRSCCSN